MQNKNLMSPEQVFEWYKKAVTVEASKLAVSFEMYDCEILSPDVDVKKVSTLKEQYLNARRQGVYKTAIVNVPLLIVYKLE